MFHLILAALVFCLLPTSALAQVMQTFRIVWTDTSSNEAGFGIERRVDSTSIYEEIRRVGANVTEFFDTVNNPPPGSFSTCYRVFSIAADGKESVRTPTACQ